MLYSYLLTRSEFKIDDAPETASRDRRYAHLVYLDMLMLMLELSGYSAKSGKKPAIDIVETKLAKNKAAKALSVNDDIRSAILRDANHADAMRSVAPQIYDKLIHSAVYADYAKKRAPELADDITLWTTVLDTIVARDPAVAEALRQAGDFSTVGFQNGIEQAKNTLRSYADSREFYIKARTDLGKSLDKAYELYLRIFQLIIDITDEQERRLEAAKSKYLATSSDLNPNMRFVNNLLVRYLRENASLRGRLEEYKVMRSEVASPLVKALLDQITASDIYKKYVDAEHHTLQSDTDFWRDVLRTIVFTSDDLLEDLEDKSVFWNDDLQIMGTFVLKTLRRISLSDGKEIDMLDKYKDAEDERFGPELFMYVVANQDEYRQYIDKFIERSNWDPERLAYMDIVIMCTAIAEILNYPAIPVGVTVNEYVEIANNYSTEKSGGFINGILYSVIKYLRDENIITK